MSPRPHFVSFAVLPLLLPASWLAHATTAFAQPAPTFSVADSEAVLGQLRSTMQEQAPRFFSPKTHAWYSQPLDQLPSARDVIDLYPNPVGYGTGMDDCPLFEGTLLVAIVELDRMTHAECLRAEACEAYRGLKLCAVAHGIPGFVARGVSVEDGRSVYITSSRDQYTHYVDALWQYYHSPLCDEQTKVEIRELLTVLADAMKEQIVAENDFGYLRADGSLDPRGLHKMWHVYAHEAARLPMIYAAAWDVARRDEHYALYRHYLIPALQQSIELRNKPRAELNRWVPPYSYYQMQCSLALLDRLEQDPRVKADIRQAMIVAKTLAAERMASAAKRNLRDLAEVLIAQLIIREFRLTDSEQTYLRQALAMANLGRGGPPTTIHLLGLYCKACQSGLMPIPRRVASQSWAPATSANAHADASSPAPLFPAARKLVKPARDPNLVVFLSDPHAGVDAAAGVAPHENRQRFDTFCARICAMQPHPAAVVIAGDLALAEGSRGAYQSLQPIVKRFDDAGIPWRICPGDTDRRASLLQVFPQLHRPAPPVSGRMVDVLETPRADFILLDTLQEGQASGALDDVQRAWLGKQFDRYRQSGKRFFVVSHHPPRELNVASLVERLPTCVGWISGHEHRWRQDSKSAPRLYSLQSTAYAPDASTRCGHTYLQMDRWEFVFRPVSADPDDVWERSIWVVRFPR